ncbi:MAG: hypothetical protein ACLQUZ_14345 [Rhizomicrobium sp.]
MSSEKSNSARRRAQNLFTASEQRDSLVRQEIEKERTASEAKTAKLKALRLAKEAADKEAAALVKPIAKAPARKKRPTATRPSKPLHSASIAPILTDSDGVPSDEAH